MRCAGHEHTSGSRTTAALHAGRAADLSWADRYLTTNLTASQKPRLRMVRSHAVTQAAADEDALLTPVLVVPNQQWTETYLGRQVTRTGTIVIFDTSGMSLFPKAMVRV